MEVVVFSSQLFCFLGLAYFLLAFGGVYDGMAFNFSVYS